jgi:Rrf2 family nitric oxide-sensitive transcriptional repressor
MSEEPAFSSRSESGPVRPEMRLVSLAAPVRHALQALGLLAASPGFSLDAAAVARRGGLPRAALSKSFQRLARGGLLESRRGPGGGYRLTRSPERVTLAEVAAALDEGDRRRGRCLLEEGPCRGDAPCALHPAAAEADALMRLTLERLTLADLIPGRRAPGAEG